MENRKKFKKELLQIAVPVTLQCLLQSSFSVVDQIMTGQLGSTSIAGIGLGGKFASIYAVVIAAAASVTGIMIAQYIGKKDDEEAGRSFYTNIAVSFILAAVFTSLSIMMPYRILGLYTNDRAAVEEGWNILESMRSAFCLPQLLPFSRHISGVPAPQRYRYMQAFLPVWQTPS